MLQDGLRLVLLDRFGHHIQDIVHDSGTKFQVVVRLNTLFRDRLRNTLAVSAFELTCQQVTKPVEKVRSKNTRLHCH